MLQTILIASAALALGFLLGRWQASRELRARLRELFLVVTDRSQAMLASDAELALDEEQLCAFSERSSIEDLSTTVSALLGEFELLAARYHLLTTNLAAAIMIRSLDGELLFCSPYTEVLTGYALSDIYRHGEDFFDNVVLEEDRERFQRAHQVSAHGEDMLVRYQVLHRRGFKMWHETRLVPVHNANGEIEAVMSVTVDVTDTLNYQNQIEEQNRDLSDFAYMVSHDLKAPIFTIKGMTSALTEDFAEQLGEEGKELIDFITQGATRLEKLVESVIEYSSISTKDSPETEVSLRAAIDSVLQDFSEQLKQTTTQIDVSEDLPKIRGSEVRVYQLFSNLIGNALKYRSPERTLEIQISWKQLTSEQILVDVKDNGLGIPADKVDDVFRPYRRAHGNDIEGSGIGLACVKKIVDRMGGTVSVKSTEGVGSTFSVVLPLSSPRAQAIPEDLVRAYQ